MGVSRAFADVEWWEHRADRAYDEQDPSGLFMPNGSLVCSFNRAFLAAAARAVIALHLSEDVACIHDWYDEEPYGGGRTFRRCSQCGLEQKRRAA